MCMTRTVYQILVLTLARFLEFRRISGPTRTRVHTRIRTGLGSYTYMCVPSAQCNLPEHRSAGLAGPVRARDPTGVAGPRTSWTGCLDGLDQLTTRIPVHYHWHQLQTTTGSGPAAASRAHAA